MSRDKLLVAICALLFLAGAASIPAGDQPLFFFVYSVLALLTFGLRLPGSSSMGFVFVILAPIHLPWADTLLLAGAAIFLLAFIRKQQPAPEELFYLLMQMTASVLATQAVYHAPYMSHLDLSLRLWLSSFACFAIYSYRGWKRWDLWSFPYYCVAAALGALFPISLVLAPLIVLVWFSYRLYGRRLERHCEESRRAGQLHLRTIETLAQAIEARDQPAARRSRRVSIYTEELAQELGLPMDEVEALRAASLLYDVGELAVPEHIFLKSGRLTAEEHDKIKIHTTIGADILDGVRFPYPVGPIVRAHHERWDGSGYPNGLKGREIPLGARILAAADAVDALASHRQHRSAFPIEEAVRRVSAEQGRAFDPQVTSMIAKRYVHWEKRVSEQAGETFGDSIFAAQREARVLFDLTQTLGSSLDLYDTAQVLRGALRQLIDFDTLALWLEKDGALAPVQLAGEHLYVFTRLRIPLGRGVSGRAAESGSVMDGETISEMEQLAGTQTTSCPFHFAMAVPLRAGDVRGALTIYRAQSSEAFTREDARILASIEPRLSLAVGNGLRFRQVHDEALTDPLTGLPNAKALDARMEDLGTSAAVVVCDLDGFKHVNDRFGHIAGNRSLEGVAEGFRKACRNRDFVARIGGDEFVLLLPRLKPEDIEARIAQFREIVQATGQRVCGEPVLDASFGAAFYPRDGATASELIACADRRMYLKKSKQRI